MSHEYRISAFKEQFNSAPGDAPINSSDATCGRYNDGFQRFGTYSTIHAQPAKMLKAPESLKSERQSTGLRKRNKDISSGKPIEDFNPFKKNEKERGWVDRLKDRMTKTFAKNKDKQEIPKKRLSSSNDFEDPKCKGEFASITKAAKISQTHAACDSAEEKLSKLLAELFLVVERPTSQKNEEIVKYANEDFGQADHSVQSLEL